MELEVGEAVSFCTECFAPLYFLAATRRHAQGHRHSPVQCAYIPSPALPPRHTINFRSISRAATSRRALCG